MPRLRKCLIHGLPAFITTSVRRGLPFVATPYMEAIIKGALASAQERYGFTLCHFVVMGNHIHLLIVVLDPQVIPDVMEHFKTEVSHAVNRLFGWTGTTLWEEGYDSPTILSAEEALEKIEYIYMNPVRAGLVSTIREYPGIHSFEAVTKTEVVEKWRLIPRTQYTELPNRTLSLEEQQALAQRLSDGPGREVELRIHPWAWLKCFEQTKQLNWEEAVTILLNKLEKTERQYRAHQVIGAHSLRLRNPRAPFVPKREGKRTVCLSHCARQRRAFITFFKDQSQTASEAYKRFKTGADFERPPPGFFFPGGAYFASLLPYLFHF